MDAAKEWPKILAFNEGATINEKAVEQHYRQRAKQLHPDAGGSTEDMQQLNLAKELALAWVATERKKLELPKPTTNPFVGGAFNPYANNYGWGQAAQSAANAQQAYAHQVNVHAQQAYGHANAARPKQEDVKSSWWSGMFR